MSEPIDLSQMPIVLGSKQPERTAPGSPVPGDLIRETDTGLTKVYVGQPDGGWQFVGETVGPVTIEEG